MRIGAILIAVCFIAGLVFYFTVFQRHHFTQEELDAQLTARVDATANRGQLSSAIQLILEEEKQNGISNELSDKLDELYLKLAREYVSKSNYDKAVDTLKNIPPDSRKFVEAQKLLKQLNGKSASTE